MTRALQSVLGAGSIRGLPCLLLVLLCLPPAAFPAAGPGPLLTFHEFQSSCIDLGHYDAGKRELTVRFVGRKTDRFYRYSNVPAPVWKKLRALNESGGVGSYLNETVVAHRDQHPFVELTLQRFKIEPKPAPAKPSR